MNQPSIISIGEVLWDLFPSSDRFGGAPANFACHAARCGAKVSMISAVGSDPRGREAIMTLQSHRVEVDLVQVDERAPTGLVEVSLVDGRPTFSIHEDTAWDHLVWNDEHVLTIQNTDAVYFGTLGQRSATSRETIRRSVELAREKGKHRFLDINLRKPFYDSELIGDSIKLANILKLSDEELAEVCSACGSIELVDDQETMLRELLVYADLEMVLMTCGSDGAVLVSNDETIYQRGIPTEVVDTVGAGDAFAAGFLVEMLQSQPLEKCLKVGCEVAAATCAHSGAVP